MYLYSQMQFCFIYISYFSIFVSIFKYKFNFCTSYSICLQSADNNDDTTNGLGNRIGQCIDEFFIILYNNIIQDQLSKTIICIGLGFSVWCSIHV